MRYNNTLFIFETKFQCYNDPLKQTTSDSVIFIHNLRPQIYVFDIIFFLICVHNLELHLKSICIPRKPQSKHAKAQKTLQITLIALPVAMTAIDSGMQRKTNTFTAETGHKVSAKHLSRDMTKPTKWLCAQRRLRSAWVCAQSDQSLRCALNG